MIEPPTLVPRIRSVLIWTGSFSFASALFLTIVRWTRWLPPTRPIAVGRVTVEGASKLADYLGAATFFLVVPALTIVLVLLAGKVLATLLAPIAWKKGTRWYEGRELTATILFTLPLYLSPFFYLTTRKEGWALFLPPLLAQAGPRILVYFETRLWLRKLLERRNAPYHSLLITAAFGWILFRYLMTGTRIAHIPTLFLEGVFVVFFSALFWGAVVMLCRVAGVVTGISSEEYFVRAASWALSLALIPVLAINLRTPPWSILPVALAAATGAVCFPRRVFSPGAARKILVWGAIPLMLFVVTYTSTAALSQWIDLFHRGESIGPASDYLRGKVPYRDVFVLHGMLDDGLLDAWLMQLFGRNVEVAILRVVLLGSFAMPALWFLGLVLFESIPLAALVVALGLFTFTDNQRILPEIVALTLLISGLKHSSNSRIAAAGVVAGVALFFSFEIGLYSIVGGFASLVVIGWLDSRRSKERNSVGRFGSFAAGCLAGTLPFLIYLAIAGALDDFALSSFVTVPSLIDPIWSLPFPDLTSRFRHDLSLRTVNEFLLTENFRYILNPLVIAIGLTFLAWRVRSAPGESRYDLLWPVVLFALISQRSALGRADFPHQYFSAFLVSPIIVALSAAAIRSVKPLWRSDRRDSQAFLATAGLILLLILFTALWVPDLTNARVNDLARYRPRVSRVGFSDAAAERTHDMVEAVRHEVQRTTRAGEPVFDFSNQPALYFFADRPNPTRFYQVPILSPLPFQLETITRLQTSGTQLVIRNSPEGFDRFDGIPNELRAPAVAAYLEDYFEPSRTVRGIEIWRRRAQVKPFSIRRYAPLHRIPSPTALTASREGREVVPSVGSVAGAAGSYWRSDMIVHNPFDVTVSLTLRYVSATTRERVLVLKPGETRSIADFVATFFNLPSTRGMLWIRHRADQPPAIRVRTYDAARSGRAALESPLTARDIAEAGSAHDELLLFGVPGGYPRRVNLGVINVGDGPASFRITATTRNGEIIGLPLEGALREEDSFLSVDASVPLGVPIDEAITVHITMKKGSAVGYASVVDGLTGDTSFVSALPASSKASRAR